MEKISISVSEGEYKKFGLKSDRLSFLELLELIRNQLATPTLKESTQLVAQYGLSGMSMDEITEEVKAVRKDVNNHPRQVTRLIIKFTNIAYGNTTTCRT